MDGWIRQHRSLAYDDGGSWAQTGTVNMSLLATLLADEYFQQAPPKSTGFEYFNQRWLRQHALDTLAAEDVQATLCKLTAATIADAVMAEKLDIKRVLICGGGLHNSTACSACNHTCTASASRPPKCTAYTPTGLKPWLLPGWHSAI